MIFGRNFFASWATRPLTVTQPLLIHSSISRREPTPEAARTFCRRSGSKRERSLRRSFKSRACSMIFWLGLRTPVFWLWQHVVWARYFELWGRLKLFGRKVCLMFCVRRLDVFYWQRIWPVWKVSWRQMIRRRAIGVCWKAVWT